MNKKLLKHPRRDLTNKSFDRITVLSFSHYDRSNGGSNDYWHCKCSCGNEKCIRGNLLVTRQVSSCGCLLRERYESMKSQVPHNIKPVGEAALKSLIRSYVDRCNKKQIPFVLSDDEFKLLISQPCFYCGVEPYKLWPRSKSCNGQIRYNGIDRKNNTIGYNIENCVSCCEICNKAKRDLPLDIFLDWINRIVAFRNTKYD